MANQVATIGRTALPSIHPIKVEDQNLDLQNVTRVAKGAIDQTDNVPTTSIYLKEEESSLVGRVFPNPGLTIVSAGLGVEKAFMGKIDAHLNRLDNHRETASLLVELGQELNQSALDVPFSNKSQDLLGRLKEKGVNLLPDELKTLTKEKRSALQTAISSGIKKHETQLTICMQKANADREMMGAILAIVKSIAEAYGRHTRNLVENARAR